MYKYLNGNNLFEEGAFLEPDFLPIIKILIKEKK